MFVLAPKGLFAETLRLLRHEPRKAGGPVNKFSKK